jgi:hypothetical protein
MYIYVNTVYLCLIFVLVLRVEHQNIAAIIITKISHGYPVLSVYHDIFIIFEHYLHFFLFFKSSELFLFTTSL